MTTLTSPLQEIANPDVTGWEWTDTYEGIGYDGVEGTYRHQIIWLKGTDKLFFITQAPQKEWGPWVPISLPERFGFDGTLQGARAAAEAFYNEGKIN